MSADRPQQGGGLSVQTLAVASLASMTAAVVIHEFWAYGAVLGAAITPIIVAVTSEALRKPVDRAARLAQERRERGIATAGQQVPTGPPAPDPRREDPFGIWQAARPEPWYRRLDRRHLRLALLTGGLAFVIGAFALTAGELVFGGSVGSGGKRTTLVPGGDRESREEREQREGETESAPAPGATQGTPEQTPATPAPQETQPAPAQTQPAPDEESDPAQPAPESPSPGGTPAPEGTAPPG